MSPQSILKYTLLSISALTATAQQFSLADGYSVDRVVTGLTEPRGIIFDSAGHLLIVEQGSGIVAVTVSEAGEDEISAGQVRSVVVDDGDLNHGIELSPDGRTLYASSSDEVYAYQYDPETMSVTGDPVTLVTNMDNSDHTTRTLWLSRQAPGMLLVSRGSQSNLDVEASDINSGHSQIKAFNITGITEPIDFVEGGVLLGWGLRNSVGVTEHPTTGGIWTVENSVDQMQRLGEDIHATNPGEELNYLGTMIDNDSPNQGGNFGYPECYAAYDTSVIPESQDIEIGSQFAIGTPNDTLNDNICRDDRIAPRLVFESHMAPLDIKFNQDGSEAWVAFHGSWNRAPLDPTGYKVSVIAFENGEPVAASTSTEGYRDIISNEDITACPDACFRPVGLAWDSNQRLYFSSDSTGDIYRITRTDTNNDDDGGAEESEIPTVPSNTLDTGAEPTETGATDGDNAGVVSGRSGWLFACGVAFIAAALVL